MANVPRSQNSARRNILQTRRDKVHDLKVFVQHSNHKEVAIGKVATDNGDSYPSDSEVKAERRYTNTNDPMPTSCVTSCASTRCLLQLVALVSEHGHTVVAGVTPRGIPLTNLRKCC